MNIEGLDQKVKQVLNRERYEHSVGVMNTAIDLAKVYNVDPNKASIAALLHDCAKNLKHDELYNYCKKYNVLDGNYSKVSHVILHAPVGAIVAREKFNIIDDDILNAIQYHTTGRINMSSLEKIIFIADYIEPNRSFKGIESIRQISKSGLNMVVLAIMDKTLKYLIEKESIININTINARNHLIKLKRNKVF